jgi:hypothetical protein
MRHLDTMLLRDVMHVAKGVDSVMHVLGRFTGDGRVVGCDIKSTSQWGGP